MSAVEVLFAEFESRAVGNGRVDLHVEQPLTLRGQVVPSDAGMAILLDRILALEFEPDGFSDAGQGRVYHYKRWV